MRPVNQQTTAARAVPILDAAGGLGLDVANNKARCFNGKGHRNGEDRTPSLAFFPDSNRFKCFGCGVSGDVIDLVKAVKGVSFGDAVAWLVQLQGGRAGQAPAASQCPPAVHIPSATDVEVYRRLYELSLPPAPTSPAGRYLLGRGLKLEPLAALGVRELYSVATAWPALQAEFDAERLRAAGLMGKGGAFLFARHALLFFYLDGSEPVFVQGRDITGQAAVKELRPVGLQCPVPYNRDVLRGEPGRVHLCEGCIDTLSALQLELPSVGVPGVHGFRDEWFALFRGVPEVEILFDDDEAGHRQGAELRARFRMRGFHAAASHPAGAKDVNDLLQSLINHGVTR